LARRLRDLIPDSQAPSGPHYQAPPAIPQRVFRLTCECDHYPPCRHHHRCKQADGWYLEQPEPGVLVWYTPAGRTYTTTPTQYAA
jgi:hypothetical protein